MISRKINPDLEAYLDQKLMGLGASADAIKKKDARLVMQYAALACIGIRETAGPNRGKLIQLFTDTVGRPDVIPWCMAFVQSMVAYAEEKTGLVSPILATEHCMTCWRETPRDQRVRFFPAAGAIVIWRHAGSDSGHTGLFLEGDNRSFHAVEGNTGGGIDSNDEVVREGDGVYRTTRPMSKVGDMELIGFLKPF